MKKVKYILSLFVVAVIVLTSAFSNKESVFNFSSLTLREGKAYMAISKNNSEDYNRELNFYFLVSKNRNLTQNTVYDYLTNNIKKATLYTDNGQVYSTDKLVWSDADKYEGIKDYFVSLAITPEIEKFSTDDKIIKIERIVLNSNDAEQEYKLDNYFVEEKETLDEKSILLSGTSGGTESFEFDYKVEKEENDVSSISLEYYQDFAPIKISNIDEFSNSREKEENSYYFKMSYGKDEKNLFLKPFLNVTYNNGEQGFVVSNNVFDALTLSLWQTYEDKGFELDGPTIIYLSYVIIIIGVVLAIISIKNYKKKIKNNDNVSFKINPLLFLIIMLLVSAFLIYIGIYFIY